MENTMIITSPLFTGAYVIGEDNKAATSGIKFKKDGTPKIIVCNKKKGHKSEVYPFEIEDVKKIMDYFKVNEMWNHYLIFVIGCNMARRIGDTLNLKWRNFFDEKTGKMRQELAEIIEEKTDMNTTAKIKSTFRSMMIMPSGMSKNMDLIRQQRHIRSCAKFPDGTTKTALSIPVCKSEIQK